MSNSIFKNIFSNVGGYFVSVVTAFIIAPITIHSLGNIGYGAWSLVSELIGYYGLLDLGIRGGVTYYVSRYSALNQQDEVKHTLASAFWFLFCCGILAFLIGSALTFGFPYIFRNDGYNIYEVRLSLFIMSSLISFSLPMSVFSGSLVGMQRFDIVSGIEVINRLLTALFTYIVLKSGGGIVALSIVQAIGRAVSWGGTLYACRIILGGIFIRQEWFKVERIIDLARYGFRNAIGEVALLIIYRMDLLVVGMLAGIDRVVFYTIASTLVSYASSLCSNIAFTFTPRFTQLESTNETFEINRLYFWGIRLTGAVVVLIVAGVLIFGQYFIKLWIGVSYINGPITDRSDIIVSVLILANFPRMMQSISWQRLLGTGRVRFLMWLNICEAISNLSLSIFLASRYGPLGVALGTFFPIMISQLIVMPLYSSKVFNITLWQLLIQGLGPPLIAGFFMVIINLTCVHFATPDTWLFFFIDIVIATILGCLLSLGIVLNQNDRRNLIAKCRVIMIKPGR